ncbi:MAG TPA: bifunctional ornithine acetyltransferase/N-acetylglutamate synthase [Chloroflexaceae bacterium]|nr:bifunctional ornithine acetyltransferase/N-acetylglutamate synthase [Chloroflexaceae bacterium]
MVLGVAHLVAQAGVDLFLTNDSRPKERALRVQLRDGQAAVLAGMAKGTRLIHPCMATLLAMLTTDVAIEQRLLQRALQQSVGRSFNRLSLDGDSSPNDGVIMLANGAAGNQPISDPASREFAAFHEALDALCADLAQQVVRDAAGSGKIISVRVRGAASEEGARQVADAVTRSRGLRAALRRGAPDWGPLLAAVGASRAELRPELLDLRVGPVQVFSQGMAAPYDQQAALQAFSGPEIEFVVDLNAGPVELTVFSCTWHEE